MKKIVLLLMLFVISASVFAKKFYTCYLCDGKWVLQPTGVYTFWFDNRYFHIGVFDGNEYKSFAQRYYVSYNKVDSFDTTRSYVGIRGNYIVFQDTIKAANGDVKYVACNYKVKELKPKDKLVLEIDNKEFTFKFKSEK